MVSPRLSILVATWNCAPQLAHFLESLAQQSWTDWELLLLDNTSSDGTANVVSAFKARLPAGNQRILWSSQPDTGIYDAWNRGLSLAQGEYLCFIGADDTFLNSSSLESIAQLTVTRAHLITACNAYCDRQGKFLRFWGSAWCWNRMRQSMNIAHPGMLIRSDLFTKIGSFDKSYSICGDYEWLLRLPQFLRTIHSSDTVLRVVQAGVSHTRISDVFRETFRAQRQHVGLLITFCCWCLNWLKYIRRRLIGLA